MTQEGVQSRRGVCLCGLSVCYDIDVPGLQSDCQYSEGRRKGGKSRTSLISELQHDSKQLQPSGTRDVLEHQACKESLDSYSGLRCWVNDLFPTQLKLPLVGAPGCVVVVEVVAEYEEVEPEVREADNALTLGLSSVAGADNNEIC